MLNVYIDIDNIIADFEQAFRKLLNKRTGKSLVKEDIKEFDFYKDFGITKEEERNIHKEFVANKGYEKLKEIEGCKKGIRELGDISKIYFITARPDILRKTTLEWLKKSGIEVEEEQLVFTKNKADDRYVIDIVVEDKWEDAIELANKGKYVILYDYPWNRKRDENGNITKHENIHRVRSWKDIVAKVNALAEEKRESIENKPAILKVWEESISVQMHFNEMIMKNRITFASILFAAFGAALAVQKLYPTSTNVGSHISSLILIIAGIGIISYGWVDIAYYYNLLVGAVKFTEQIDRKYRGIALTTSITKEIGHKRAMWTLIGYYLIILIALVLILIFKSKI